MENEHKWGQIDFNCDNNPILTLTHDGKIYWRGREVVEDKDLVAALRDVVMNNKAVSTAERE